MSGVVRWDFDDPVLDETYVFDVNPSEGGSPKKKKNILSTPTVAPDGVVLQFEGYPDPDLIEWSGTILYESQFNTLYDWWTKKHQIQLTDDLGRQVWIYIVDFKFERRRSSIYPWKHGYSITAHVLDWPSTLRTGPVTPATISATVYMGTAGISASLVATVIAVPVTFGTPIIDQTTPHPDTIHAEVTMDAPFL